MPSIEVDFDNINNTNIQYQKTSKEPKQWEPEGKTCLCYGCIDVCFALVSCNLLFHTVDGVCNVALDCLFVCLSVCLSQGACFLTI